MTEVLLSADRPAEEDLLERGPLVEQLAGWVLNAPTAHGFVIGAVTNSVDPNFGGYFNGTLDEVSLYTSVLTPATVTAHRNAGL